METQTTKDTLNNSFVEEEEEELSPEQMMQIIKAQKEQIKKLERQKQNSKMMKIGAVVGATALAGAAILTGDVGSAGEALAAGAGAIVGAAATQVVNFTLEYLNKQEVKKGTYYADEKGKQALVIKDKENNLWEINNHQDPNSPDIALTKLDSNPYKKNPLWKKVLIIANPLMSVGSIVVLLGQLLWKHKSQILRAIGLSVHYAACIATVYGEIVAALAIGALTGGLTDLFTQKIFPYLAKKSGELIKKLFGYEINMPQIVKDVLEVLFRAGMAIAAIGSSAMIGLSIGGPIGAVIAGTATTLGLVGYHLMKNKKESQ